MPQMAPLNWILMFVIFIVLMLMVANKIYFLTEKNMNIKLNNVFKEDKQLKWSW